MEVREFGVLPDGTPVQSYTFGSSTLQATVLTYGGALQKLCFRGTDIICGFDTLEDYLNHSGCQGALIGRYANRIAGGSYSWGGKAVTLPVNEPDRGNCLHGGSGFHTKVWEAEPVTGESGEGLILSRISPDGEDGFPGTVAVSVSYLILDTCLYLHYLAKSDADTAFNMTNHSYFNMNGFGSGPIDTQTLQLFADRMSVVNSSLIPVGTQSVEGTPFDFQSPKALSPDLLNGSDPQMILGNGLDHNFYLSGDESVALAGTELNCAAVLSGTAGRLTVCTDLPCIQVYSANFMNGPEPMKGGIPQKPRHAICLETQVAPDSPPRGEAILREGELFDSTTAFCFESI
ncbi:MAG: galactose mutarotase [Clostridia bacterium]|nr:galactose mutarotase [Clostridia bacterium]